MPSSPNPSFGLTFPGPRSSSSSNEIPPSFLLTVDVEDWFQVENFKQYISFQQWDSHRLRVRENTLRILDLMAEYRPGGAPLQATFFLLGWLAERLPDLVREIRDRGHEVASHGQDHELCPNLSEEALLSDLIRSRELLESITGEPVAGYRAPSFSISDTSLRLVRSAGYRYDSSYNSFAVNQRYGRLNLDQNRRGIAVPVSPGFHELPISNLHIKGRILPFGGGGYFRLMPFCLFRKGVRRILEEEDAYLFYLHPWEIDPDQPRVRAASPVFRFRHYINLRHTAAKLRRLIRSFSAARFLTCRDYLDLRS